MPKAIIVAIVLALLGLTTACGKPKPAAATNGTDPAWKMTLSTVPDPPVNNKEGRFLLLLLDPAGQPVSGAQVRASLEMVGMDMGKNEVGFAEKGNGSYEGTGKFTMAGPWKVVVSAAARGKSTQQTFPLVVYRE